MCKPNYEILTTQSKKVINIYEKHLKFEYSENDIEFITRRYISNVIAYCERNNYDIFYEPHKYPSIYLLFEFMSRIPYFYEYIDSNFYELKFFLTYFDRKFFIKKEINEDLDIETEYDIIDDDFDFIKINKNLK